jgi:hypothetical protein
MMSLAMTDDTIEAYRRLVQRVLEGSIPRGDDFDACRAVLRGGPGGEPAFHALCMLLEGALAEPTLPIDDTQQLVALLKGLAAGTVGVEELL